MIPYTDGCKDEEKKFDSKVLLCLSFVQYMQKLDRKDKEVKDYLPYLPEPCRKVHLYVRTKEVKDNIASLLQPLYCQCTEKAEQVEKELYHYLQYKPYKITV